MHRIAVVIFCSTLLFTSSSCKTVLVKSAKISQEVRAQSAQWNEAFTRRDLVSLMKIFADDAQLATAGGKWKNKDEGQRRFASLLLKRPDLSWFLKPHNVVVNEVWAVAYETGEWTEWWSEPDGVAKITGTYFMMWKKTTGEPWLIHAAVFTPLLCTGSSYCRPHTTKSTHEKK